MSVMSKNNESWHEGDRKSGFCAVHCLATFDLTLRSLKLSTWANHYEYANSICKGKWEQLAATWTLEKSLFCSLLSCSYPSPFQPASFNFDVRLLDLESSPRALWNLPCSAFVTMKSCAPVAASAVEINGSRPWCFGSLSSLGLKWFEFWITQFDVEVSWRLHFWPDQTQIPSNSTHEWRASVLTICHSTVPNVILG